MSDFIITNTPGILVTMNREPKKKRIRCSNFDQFEQLRLLEEVEKLKHIIENKSTNKITCNEKTEAWEKITLSFNTNNLKKRAMHQLQVKYENLKTEARRTVAAQKSQHGGPYYDFATDVVLSKVLDIINIKTVPGAASTFNSDRIENDTTSNNSLKECKNEILEIIDVIPSDDNSGLSVLNCNMLNEPIMLNTVPLADEATEDVSRQPSTSGSCDTQPTKRHHVMQSVSDWDKYTPTKLKRRLNPKLRNNRYSPTIMIDKYYEKKIELIETQMNILKHNEQRNAEEHDKKMKLLDLEILEKQRNLTRDLPHPSN